MSKTKPVDVATAKSTAKPKNRKSKLKKAEEVNRREELAPIPAEAYKDPIGWADKHVETLVPQSVKEVEYALKFGDNRTRLQIGLEILAMKGISSKTNAPPPVPPAVNLTINTGLLPFQQPEPKTVSNEQPLLEQKKFK